MDSRDGRSGNGSRSGRSGSSSRSSGRQPDRNSRSGGSRRKSSSPPEPIPIQSGQNRSRSGDRRRKEASTVPARDRNVRMPERSSRSSVSGSRNRSRRGGYGRADPNETRANRAQIKRSIYRRTWFLIAVFGVLMFIPLCWRLFSLCVLHHDDYQKMATEQQTLDLTLSAGRGNIYDTNGNIMAMSSTVYDLILSPRDLVASVDKSDYTDKNTKVLDQAAYDAAIAAKQDQMVEDLMTMIPDLDREKVVQQVHATKYAYREIRTQMEEEEHKAIQEYITENRTSSYLYFNPGTKRYYPYASLAAQVLGFVNTEGGAIGIEAAYDDMLEGTEGRVVTTRTGRGNRLYNDYSEYIDAVDGYNVNLTLDSTIQGFAEKTLEEGIQAYDVRNGAFCLVMDPNTGAILGMASSPDFDPNNYSVIADSILQANMVENQETIYKQLKETQDKRHQQWEEKPEEYRGEEPELLSEEELRTQAENQAYSDAVNTQWRSKVLDSRYEPGSTFKAMVLAAALEEGVISENDTFYCKGYVNVPGYDKPINCSNRAGHGTQTLEKAVGNSCNPAFIEIGRRLGLETFYDYFEAFGMTERTGIELPGEASLTGAFWSRDEMTNVDLAVASFGQRFEVTPLQMVAGFSSVINGGNLVKPYLVKSITTRNGDVVQNTEPTVVRQVVSQQTSQRASAILEKVVSEGTGNNAYVAGYRIGGKTGSAETHEKGRTIVSFMGFAPADNPRVIVLLAYDKPQESSDPQVSTTGVYISGGNMAAPKAGPLIAEILDYMGVEKIYEDNEGAAANVRAPEVIGQTLEEVEKTLQDTGLKYRTVGSGETVTSQVPDARVSIPGGSTMILYLGDETPPESAAVPGVMGLTYENARATLESAGFFMRATGVSTYYSNTTLAMGQSLERGEIADLGTVIDVQFTNVIEDGPVGALDDF